MKISFLTIVAVAAFTVLATSGGQANAQRHPAEPEMVFVRGGTFQMGGASEEEGGDDDELPVHEVTVSGFYMGKYEVTQAQWKALMNDNPSEFKGDDLPVEQVSWEEVQVFIERLNSATGKRYRLPTEAEWEYAARGGNQSEGYSYSGSDSFEDVAWIIDNSGNKTHPVGTKMANKLGIHDMSGNVYEWCHDWYGPYPDSAQRDPSGASSGTLRVNRGGGWDGEAADCRVAYRNNGSPVNAYNYLGFRLVYSAE
ncbi:MAG: formylglycine-generating enzyme family protein [Odoribacteraceae bacterium]|jgi:formylglycine-generating enzyme required for sulfatase activity|nr:formylglycine-generating enzyme family protein [Odoribacteraceae bacterium]